MVKVRKIVKTCYACPSQWEGITDDNRQIYVRYRSGCLSIRVGAAGDMSEFGGVHGEEILFIDRRDKYHAVMGYSQLKRMAAGVVEFPQFYDLHIDWKDEEPRCPECGSKILKTTFCMMGHWCGELSVPSAEDVK